MIGTALLTLLALTGQPAPSQDARQATFAIQVALDRAGFSTGVIDGRIGANTRRAIDAYRQQNGADPSPFPDPLLEYRITAEDEAGPFVVRFPRPHGAVEAARRSAIDPSPKRSQSASTPRPNCCRAERVGDVYGGRQHPSAQRRAARRARDARDARAARTSEGRFERRSATVGTSGRLHPPQQNDKPDVIVRVSRSASSLTVTDADGKIALLRAGHDRQRARPASNRRMEGQWRTEQPDLQVQPRSLLGREPGPHEGDGSARAERPCRRRLDRHLKGTLRAARLAGTVADRPDRVARMRSADELGRAARRGARQAGHARGVRRMKRHPVASLADWRRDLRTFVAGAGCGFLARLVARRDAALAIPLDRRRRGRRARSSARRDDRSGHAGNRVGRAARRRRPARPAVAASAPEAVDRSAPRRAPQS